MMSHYVSGAEIATMLGVSRDLVAKWHYRRKMPTPAGRTGNGPFWEWKRVEPWIEWQKRAKVSDPRTWARWFSRLLGYRSEREFWDRVRFAEKEELVAWTVPSADGTQKYQWGPDGVFVTWEEG